MEPIIISRTAMTGWLFLAVLIGALWSSQSAAWQELLKVLQTQQSSPLALGVLGAIVGIGAPPAVGFLFERLVTLILILSRRTTPVYSRVVGFDPSLFEVPTASNTAASTGAAAFQVFFYTYADEKLLNWARRRLAQVYASAAGATAILVALIIGRFIAGSFNLEFTAISLFVAALLVNDARLQSSLHRDTINAWIDTFALTITPAKIEPTSAA